MKSQGHPEPRAEYTKRRSSESHDARINGRVAKEFEEISLLDGYAEVMDALGEAKGI